MHRHELGSPSDMEPSERPSEDFRTAADDILEKMLHSTSACREALPHSLATARLVERDCATGWQHHGLTPQNCPRKSH